MPRYFAIIPAAGNSTRMGAPKLLLPMGSGTMIEQTLAAWQASRVEKVIVIVRPDDRELAHLCSSCGATVVVPPTAPPEMKDSVLHGLRHIEANFSPTAEDAWLLAPADMPGLSPRIIETLILAHQPNQHHILIPTLGGQRGHPILFPWAMASEVFSLSASEGLNVLRQRHASLEVPCDSTEPMENLAFNDVDTPEDYMKSLKQVPSNTP